MDIRYLQALASGIHTRLIKLIAATKIPLYAQPCEVCKPMVAATFQACLLIVMHFQERFRKDRQQEILVCQSQWRHKYVDNVFCNYTHCQKGEKSSPL